LYIFVSPLQIYKKRGGDNGGVGCDDHELFKCIDFLIKPTNAIPVLPNSARE
jgi:hypothetical protein